jgi:hypothetical protein
VAKVQHNLIGETIMWNAYPDDHFSRVTLKYGDQYTITTPRPMSDEMRDILAKVKIDIPKKETPVNEQASIDAEVKERIAKPKREAEVARRVEAVGKLEVLGTAAVGTAITFTRKLGSINYSYAALKYADDAWAVTGNGSGLGIGPVTWEALLTWMTTGPALVSDVKVATAFDTIL